MALGKNMKVEKLIPLKSKDEVKPKSKAKVKPSPLVEEITEDASEVEGVIEDKPTNVNLDAFFEGLDNGSEEVNSFEKEDSPESKLEKEEQEVDKIDVVPETLSQTDEVEVTSESTSKKVSQEAPKAIAYEDFESETLKLAFKPSRRKTQKRIFIEIEGSMTINNVEILHSKVNQVFSNFEHVELNMSNIIGVDLTVIQLFHTIRMSYLAQNKHVYINAEFTREDRKLLNACGFTEFQTQKPSSN